MFRGRHIITLGLVLVASAAQAAFEASELAVLFNANDRDSRIIAGIYAERHGIPDSQRIGLDLNGELATLPIAQYQRIARRLREKVPSHVQAYALVWDRPYRVGCMSVTSAFAFGFDEQHCASGCRPTAPNPWFGSVSARPYTAHGVRPSMLLSAGSTVNTLALIERGNAAGKTRQRGAAYLVTTTDMARNTRAPRFPLVNKLFGERLPVHLVSGAGIKNRKDVLFYFTGTKTVPWLETLGFVPGAMADHLTSAGGVLDGTGQMTAMAWLQAGATGSYGTVVEPCNFPQKFPDPPIAIAHYLNGDTLLEAYWKSVQWPGQGLFIGDPLARPFAPAIADR